MTYIVLDTKCTRCSFFKYFFIYVYNLSIYHAFSGFISLLFCTSNTFFK